MPMVPESAVPEREPDSGEVRVWTCSTDRPPTSLDACSALLSPQELAQAGRRRRAGARAEAIVVSAFRRTVLARETGVAPQALRFRSDCRWCGDPDHGKPALDGPAGVGLGFSLAHTRGLAVLAAASAEVGVDVERRVDWDVTSASRLALVDAERAAVSAAPEPAEAFLRLWTRKEAYLKGIGLGLAHEPALVTFAAEPGPWARALDGGAATPWRVRALDLGEPWIAALAVECGAPAVRLQDATELTLGPRRSPRG
jgi:4'-phosphopantetheinyl transferase